MIQLYIANKNYSSWSMRPWMLLRQAGIDFEEVFVRFDSFAPEASLNPDAVARALAFYDHAYQGAADSAVPIWKRRHG